MSKMQLVLSLMPGVDLLGMAFKEEGFCVVQGGDVIFGGDVRKEHYPPGKFDGIISGPPCQVFSALKRLNPHAGERFGNLIPEFERCVSEAKPEWFVMEEVPKAPPPTVCGYRVHELILNNRWFGSAQERTRRWSFGTADGRKLLPEIICFESRDYSQAVTGSARAVPVKLGGSGKVKRTYTEDGKRHGPNNGPRESIARMLELQGAPPAMLDDCPFTASATRKMIGNGVPIPMGRAIARAVKEATEQPQ